MHFLHHHHHHLRHPTFPLQIRTLYDAVSTLKFTRDRGFDHAVDRERHLQPLLNLKTLILTSPSKSLPITLISDSKNTLNLPFRPIEFTRKYPSIFTEFHPGSLNIPPHIKLTEKALSLDSEENLLYQSFDYKESIAKRVLKLLMISRVNRIPIFVLEKLKWDLGLPENYEKCLVPEFPDYFRVVGEEGNQRVLELVFWNDEFAVSELERRCLGEKKDGKIEFLLKFSKDFEVDKKYRKWVDEWQKLPYVSPYENAMHLSAKSDESDKWAVAVLHELLNLFVGKKAERETLLYLGEYLGLRSRFNRAFLQHPGIFYVSSRLRTHTVVLRDAYKRGMLIQREDLMNMRYKYVQLMNVGKDEEKNKKETKGKEKKSSGDVKRGEGGEGGGEDDEEGEEEDADMYDSSDEESDDDDEDVVESRNASKKRGQERNTANFEEQKFRRGDEKRANRRKGRKTSYESTDRISGGTYTQGSDMNVSRRSANKFDVSGNNGRHKTEKTSYGGNSTRFSGRTNTRDGDMDGPRRSPRNFDDSGDRARYKTEKTPYGGNSTRFSGRSNTRGGDMDGPRRSYDGNSTRFSGRTNTRDSDMDGPRRFTRRFDNSGNKPWLRTEKTPHSGSSTRFSGRTNVRGGDERGPRRSSQESDSSRNWRKYKTEKTST